MRSSLPCCWLEVVCGCFCSVVLRELLGDSEFLSSILSFCVQFLHIFVSSVALPLCYSVTATKIPHNAKIRGYCVAAAVQMFSPVLIVRFHIPVTCLVTCPVFLFVTVTHLIRFSVDRRTLTRTVRVRVCLPYLTVLLFWYRYCFQ